MAEDDKNLPEEGKTPKIVRGALQVVGGAVPFAGGLFSAAAGAWSENEQEKVNNFFKHWIKCLKMKSRKKKEPFSKSCLVWIFTMNKLLKG